MSDTHVTTLRLPPSLFKKIQVDAHEQSIAASERVSQNDVMVAIIRGHYAQG